MSHNSFLYDDNGFLTGSNNKNPWKNVIRIIVVLLLMMLALRVLSSCKTTKPDTVIVVRDSIRTEVHTKVVYVPDTIPVVLPPETVKVVSPDTLSRIETGFAVSEAALRDGFLYHSIWNKQAAIDVPVEHKETTRDSIVYREKEVPVPYPVPKYIDKPLSWWQKTRIKIANIAICLAGLWLVYFVIKNRKFWLTLLKNIF